MNESNKLQRIAKVIARSGLCSRREAEKLIEQGRVSVDGKIIETPATKISGNEKIRVDRQLIPEISEIEMWLFHKPVGTITSRKDEKGRKTIFDILPPSLQNLKSIGRLDMNSEGLLLLTNDGGLARTLELPTTAWKRKYRVRVHGYINKNKLKSLEKGITIDGIKYAPAIIDYEPLEKKTVSNNWITVTITEGKNREIRKMMEWAGLQVNRLIRVAYGPFQLGNIPKGEIKQIKGKVLKEQLGSLL